MEPQPWELEWHDRYSVGIPEIDADHKAFICHVNDLSRALIDIEQHNNLKQRLYELLGETKSHFVREEYHFLQLRYPDTNDHARKHAELISAIGSMLDNIDDYRPMYEWIETGMAVKYALVTHFSIEDAKYAKFQYNSSLLQLVKF